MKKILNFLLICILAVSLMPIKVQAKDTQLQLVNGDLVTYGSWNGEKLIWQVANVNDSKIYLITYDLLRKKGEYAWSRPVFSMAMDYPQLDRMNEPNGFPYLGEKTTITPVIQYAYIRDGDPKTILNTYTGSTLQKWLNQDSAGFDAKVFSTDEKKAILRTEMAEEQYVNTRSWEGYAFLPSSSEIKQYDILNISARSSALLDPHLQATNEKIKEIEANTDLVASAADSPIGYGQRWWTRTPSEVYHDMVVVFGTSRITHDFVYQDSEGAIGIRPCINLDLHKVESVRGNGTIEAPYQLAPLRAGAPEHTTPPTETAPEGPKPEEPKPEEPKNDIGTDTITDIKNLYTKNNNLGANATPSNFPVYLNGNKVTLSTQPMIIKGTTYLPVRALGDLLGLTVSYDEKEGVATLNDIKTANRLDLPLGYTYALHNGSIVPIDSNDATKGIPSINGISYLPLRFVATSLGYNIQFNDNSIYITQ